ncbi:MAG: hypothetical protein GY862_12870 [Gammaproteobacteria bacterium]|nr:hypothetical protein [Gammaproteobacteria bacterium]
MDGVKNYQFTWDLERIQFGNKFPEDTLNQLGNLFSQTIKLVFELFGEKAFWLGDWQKRPALAVYDPLMYAFSQHIKNAETISKHRDEFQEGIKQLYQNNKNEFKGRELGKKQQQQRIELFNKLITDITGLADER